MAAKDPGRQRPFVDPARAPVSTLLVAAAVAVFVAGLAGKSTRALVLDVRAFFGEPWRLWTTILVHVGPIHLLFNALWILRVGGALEARLGSLRLLALALVLGGGASLAEYAFAGSGVGLSGVGYGLVAFGWALRFEPRFSGVVDRRVALLFAGWFVLCVITTLTGILPVGNFAHGGGAILGGLAAQLLIPRRPALVRGLAGLTFVAAIGGLYAGATVLRPVVNRSSHRGEDAAYLGFEALERHDDAVAERWLRESVRVAPDRAASWFNLGVALARQDRDEEALAATRRAWELEPDEAHASGLSVRLAKKGMARLGARDAREALALCEEATRLDPRSTYAAACVEAARLPAE